MPHICSSMGQPVLVSVTEQEIAPGADLALLRTSAQQQPKQAIWKHTAHHLCELLVCTHA